MKIVIIDDEPDFIEIMRPIIKSLFQEAEVAAYCNWKEYEPTANDIVIHDLTGVGNKKVADGIKYISCSGTIEIQVDLPKPFSKNNLKEAIERAMT